MVSTQNTQLMSDWIQHDKISVYELFDLLYEEKVEYIYRGKFDPKITDGILSLAETNLDTTDSKKIKKRVYFILVEGLQNITHHQDKNKSLEEFNEGFLAIQKKETEFAITTGNLINNTSISDLQEKLDQVNKLSKTELKQYYRQILDNETFSQKGGAGLGLIEIARKSGNKINYDFQQISDSHSYFYMQTKISYSSEKIEKEVQSMSNMKIIHHFFNNRDIILNVTGIFNHDKLVYILSILESHLNKQIVLKNKIFSMMIELMQNIVRHAADIEINDIVGKHAVFFITSNEDEISLNSGNFILSENVSKLQNYITKINEMDMGELNKFHFNTLISYKTERKTSTGLGLLDMRIKSGTPIFFYIQKIDEKFSFISIKVSFTRGIKREKNLNIKGLESTPNIVLDEKNGKFMFCGNSYPENAFGFYSPVCSWIDNYAENPRMFSLFEFKFNYLNTSSQQELIKIFKKIELIAKSNAVVVRWYYSKDDIDAYSFGIEFSSLFDIDFKLVEYEDTNCL